MSKVAYPMWWDTTITIYNKVTDTTTHVISWYKTVVDNCFWKKVGGTVTVGTTIINTDSIVCRIPKDDRYLPPNEYHNLSTDDMGNHFTLVQGDLVFLGEITDTIDEYTQGSRSTDIINKYRKYQGCMEIKDITINVTSGMSNPHYHIQGL